MKERTTERMNLLTVDPCPRFDLSPNLYMQFMEPLGATDGSVEADWDHLRAEWRDDVIQVTKELAPPLMRWGGCLSSYYRWREGVGPGARRKPMHNLLWGGIESNQVGTHEFVDFCRRVGGRHKEFPDQSPRFIFVGQMFAKQSDHGSLGAICNHLDRISQSFSQWRQLSGTLILR